MLDESVEVRKEATRLGRTEQGSTEMDLGTNTYNMYALGHGNLYYPIWNLLTKPEKDAVSALMRTSAYPSCGSGKRNTGAQANLEAKYIYSSKMHSADQLFAAPAFFSIELGHAVCVTHSR